MISYWERDKIMYVYPDYFPSVGVEYNRYSLLFTDLKLLKYSIPITEVRKDYKTLLPREFT